MRHSDLVAGAGYPFPSRLDLVVRAAYSSQLHELAAIFFAGRLNSSYAASRALELRTDLSDPSTRLVLPDSTDTIDAAASQSITAASSTSTASSRASSAPPPELLFIRVGNASHAEMAPLWLLRSRFHLSRLTLFVDSARDTLAPTPFSLSFMSSSQAGALIGGGDSVSSYEHYPQPTLSPLLARTWTRSGLVELSLLASASASASAPESEAEVVRYALRTHMALLRLLPEDFLVAHYPAAYNLLLVPSSDRTLLLFLFLLLLFLLLILILILLFFFFEFREYFLFRVYSRCPCLRSVCPRVLFDCCVC